MLSYYYQDKNKLLCFWRWHSETSRHKVLGKILHREIGQMLWHGMALGGYKVCKECSNSFISRLQLSRVLGRCIARIYLQ